jgi:hypothetical protein
MGWASRWVSKTNIQPSQTEILIFLDSGDPVQSLSIKFSTKEDAILFAERQGYDYWIDAPKEGKFTPKVYANNFKVRITQTSFYTFILTDMLKNSIPLENFVYITPNRWVC